MEDQRITGVRDVTVAEAASTVAALLARLGPPVAFVAVGRVDPSEWPMMCDAEMAAVVGATRARQAEFATGRRLLRSLLGEDLVVPRSPSGAPELPADAVASISHADGLVIVIAEQGGDRFVGVDLEPTGAVDAATAPQIVRSDEAALEPTLAHCAKEAAYKAWSSAGGRFLEHHDIRVRADAEMYEAEVIGDGVRIRGAWGRTTEHTLAVAVLARRVRSAASRGGRLAHHQPKRS